VGRPRRRARGRFYWYVTVRHATVPGFAIGVAVADRPEGPFVDARGSALVTNAMTRGPVVNGREMDWDDIDPAVFVDADGQAYLFWGNTRLKYARLAPDMTTLDGPIVEIDVPRFTEAPGSTAAARPTTCRTPTTSPSGSPTPPPSGSPARGPSAA
jgi:hypothetical protein